MVSACAARNAMAERFNEPVEKLPWLGGCARISRERSADPTRMSFLTRKLTLRLSVFRRTAARLAQSRNTPSALNVQGWRSALPARARPRRARSTMPVLGGGLKSGRRKRGIFYRIRARLPGQRVILAAVARPGVEHIRDAGQLRAQFGNGAHQHSLERRHRLVLVPVDGKSLAQGRRPVVVHPVDAQLRIELLAEARCKEAIAVQAPRRVQDEHH